MTTYLGYCQGGKTTKAEGRDHTQFYVQRELALLGIDAWVGRKISFVRRGKRRDAEPIESPALPNYIFMEMTPEQFMLAKDVKYLASTFHLLTKQDIEGRKAVKPQGGKPGCKAIVGLNHIKAAVEAAYKAAQRVDANSRAEVAQYKKGASLSVLSGPFADMLVSFEALVNSPDVPWPRVEVIVDGLGARVQLDPLDVKEAG